MRSFASMVGVRCCRGTVWHLWGDGAGDGTVYRRRRGVPPANDNGAGHQWGSERVKA